MKVISNGENLTIQRKSKWTWEAVNDGGKSIATDKSKKKLLTKLNVDELVNAERKIRELAISLDHKKPVQPIKIDVPDSVKKIAASITKRTTSKKPNKSNTPKSDKSDRPSMRQITLDMIKDGHDDDNILSYVNTSYPKAKYNRSHVKWYRSNFAKSGLITPEFAPKRSKTYKEWLAKQ